MATDPVKTANGIMLFIPANENNIIQPGQRIPGTMIQPPEMAQYVDQLFGRPRNQQKQQHWVMAIQIFIGLIHIGFGGVSAAILFQKYLPMVTLGGYPFWGGLFFIASGSLSVSADKHFNSNLLQCSLGMNITSAVTASFGIILYLTELGVNSYLYSYAFRYDGHSDNMMSIGVGFGVLLLLFSILEFSITVSVVHFGCQATCCSPDIRIDALPCTVAEDCVTLVEASPTAPAYNPADFSPNTLV